MPGKIINVSSKKNQGLTATDRTIICLSSGLWFLSNAKEKQQLKINKTLIFLLMPVPFSG